MARLLAQSSPLVAGVALWSARFSSPNQDTLVRLLVNVIISVAMSDASKPNARVLSSNVDEFYSAVSPHVDKMRRVAARLGGVDNRDDIVQDALLQAWRARTQFDPARGTLSAWLLAITAHQATKVRRRIGGVLVGRRPTSPDLDDKLAVHAAVSRLTRREKLAVDCFYFADLSIAETAAVMGCSEGTVKSTLASARERLRGLLR